MARPQTSNARRLATVMALEKNVRWGVRLARPVGAGLAGAGVLSVVI